ncbi:hypothetical protein HF264_25980 [Rhizobium leguminosarum]|jgi:hypothetical protein|uniref:hypothetical protein n=1 Tax=Rhizobium TaxID=379 RepID=UPI001C90506B|nr:hypothetical protein [Rhizobium leguminosarum]MBY2943107.1 hypothetical protein [Rhizobium leguminosarum]
MRHRLSFLLSFVSAFVVIANAAAAVDIQKIAGHEIAVEGTAFDNELKVDGRSIHKDAIIGFKEIAIVDGTPALIGYSANGGNACDSSPFVLSFPPGGEPKMDGPIDTCFSVEHQVEGDRILFSTNPGPGHDSERWSWTPKDGIAELAAEPFKANTAADWSNLRERKLKRPSEAFANAGVVASIKNLLGPDFAWYQELMNGVAGGEFKGDDYVGTSCRPHMCSDEAGLLFLASRQKAVYAAWRPDGQKIVVRPPIKQWPEKAKLELRAWARKWQ